MSCRVQDGVVFLGALFVFFCAWLAFCLGVLFVMAYSSSKDYSAALRASQQKPPLASRPLEEEDGAAARAVNCLFFIPLRFDLVRMAGGREGGKRQCGSILANRNARRGRGGSEVVP